MFAEIEEIKSNCNNFFLQKYHVNTTLLLFTHSPIFSKIIEVSIHLFSTHRMRRKTWVKFLAVLSWNHFHEIFRELISRKNYIYEEKVARTSCKSSTTWYVDLICIFFIISYKMRKNFNSIYFYSPNFSIENSYYFYNKQDEDLSLVWERYYVTKKILVVNR